MPSRTISLRIKFIIISTCLGVFPVLMIGGFSLLKFDSFAREVILKSYKGMEDQAYVIIKNSVEFVSQKIEPLIKTTPRLATRLALSSAIPEYINSESRAIMAAQKEAIQVLSGLLETCRVEYRLKKKQVGLAEYSFDYMIAKRRNIYLSSTTTIEWAALNQYTREKMNITLPEMIVGTESIRKVYDYEDDFVPIVDDLQEFTGVNCTFFQQMNASGDLLRIATNVQRLDNKRAIDTYLPATLPNGTPHPVVSAILKGESFQGLSYEMETQYISSYKPIFDDSGNLLGAFFIGVPVISKTLSDAVTRSKVGKLGETFILNKMGFITIHPNKDLVGKHIIHDLGLPNFKEVLEKSQEDDILQFFYQIQNIQKFVVYSYIPERDWIVCVNGQLDEFVQYEKQRTEALLKNEIKNIYLSSKIKTRIGDKYIFNQIRYLNYYGQEMFSLQFGEFTNDLKHKGKEEWFLNTMKLKKEGVFTSGVIIADNTYKPEMRFSAPVYDQNSLKGVIVLSLDWDIVNELIQEGAYGKTGHAFIINEQGTIVSHPEISIKDQINFSNTRFGELAYPVRNKMLTGGSGSGRYMFNGVDYFIYFVPLTIAEKQYCLAATGSVDDFFSMANFIKSDAEQNFRSIFQIILTSLCICIVVAVILGIFISRYFTQPIIRVVDFTQKVSKGNLTKTLTSERKDEIGTLISATNSMVLEFRRIICDMQAKGTHLTGSSEKMVRIAGKLASNSEKMTMQSNNVAAASEEMTININSIATAIKQMNQNVRIVSQTTRQMSENVSSVASAIEEMSCSMVGVGENARQGSKIAEQTMALATIAGNTMKNLGDSAIEISGVTEVIKRIAERTEILAVNAAIEASAAGETGRSFSVVAGEITKFADQSARAAEDIAERIANVQGNVRDAMKVINDVSAIIADMNQSSETITSAVDEQTKAANEIATNISKAQIRANEIANAMAELELGVGDITLNASFAAKGTLEVADNIQGVSKASIDTEESSKQVNESANEMDNFAIEIQEVVKRFNVALN